MPLTSEQRLVLSILFGFTTRHTLESVSIRTGYRINKVIDILNQLDNLGLVKTEVFSNITFWKITAAGENALRRGN